MAQTIGEPEARPNDELRAALLEALDLADRAGVALSYACGNAHGGRCTLVSLQGRDAELPMSRSDALRIALRARGSEVEASTVHDLERGGRGPWVALQTAMSGGVRLEVYTQATPDEVAAARDELEARTVEAVLQS